MSKHRKPTERIVVVMAGIGSGLLVVLLTCIVLAIENARGIH